MIEHLYSYIEFWVELITILVALAGVIISGTHAIYYSKIKEVFARRLRDNFFWDAALYAVTFVMGFALFTDTLWLVRIDMVIRPIVIIIAVVASVRLYNHYKVFHDKNNSD